jgi:hypothetical protein
MARTTRHAPRPCPWCGRANDSASDPRGHTSPSPGDGMLCWTCGEWQIWEATHMRRPNETEAHELAADVRCKRMVTAWQTLAPHSTRRTQ